MLPKNVSHALLELWRLLRRCRGGLCMRRARLGRGGQGRWGGLRRGAFGWGIGPGMWRAGGWCMGGRIR